MVMEFAVGRASQKSSALSFDTLEPKGSKWHLHKYTSLAGNYLLMMFYTPIAGWMLIYCWKMLSGAFTGLDAAGVEAVYSGMLADPLSMTIAMAVVVVGCFAICSFGLQKGVEKITKVMMICLLAIMAVLAIHSLTLSGAKEGLRFYLFPDFSKLSGSGFMTRFLTQWVRRFSRLASAWARLRFSAVTLTRSVLCPRGTAHYAFGHGVALIAGLIIFPACFTFGVNPDSGPNLIFVTLPNVFISIPAAGFGARCSLFSCCSPRSRRSLQ